MLSMRTTSFTLKSKFQSTHTSASVQFISEKIVTRRCLRDPPAGTYTRIYATSQYKTSLPRYGRSR